MSAIPRDTVRAATPIPQPPSDNCELTACWVAFEDLSTLRLHAVLRRRQDVFVVEQNCPFPEIDGRDPLACHLLVEESVSGDLAAYLRLLPPSEGTNPRLGRIVTSSRWRGHRLGDYLMKAGLSACANAYPDQPIELSAQAHLEAFYASHGFRVVSETYLEDGIPHLDMRHP